MVSSGPAIWSAMQITWRNYVPSGWYNGALIMQPLSKIRIAATFMPWLLCLSTTDRHGVLWKYLLNTHGNLRWKSH